MVISRIFGHGPEVAEDIVDVNWLSLLLNGCSKVLEMDNPQTQVSMQVQTIPTQQFPSSLRDSSSPIGSRPRYGQGVQGYQKRRAR